MGILAKSLAPPSSHSVKKADGWATLMDRIGECMTPADLDDFEQWLSDYPLEYPAAWGEPLAEVVEKRREELEDEDIGLIIRDRFDFS